jgi:hypothetical protein
MSGFLSSAVVPGAVPELVLVLYVVAGRGVASATTFS